MSFPSIDHSLLSPSGRMSKRARAQAMKREYDRLFAGIGDMKGEGPPQPTVKEKLLTQAKALREMAARGMCTRKYSKEADRLEALAKES